MTSPRRSRQRRASMERLESRRLLTLLGQQLFPAPYPWNQSIANAPVASNSSAIINNIINLYGDGRLHPDFGQDTQSTGPLFGIPFNIVHGNAQPKLHVVIDAFASESDVADAPIPANAVLEGDNQDGPVVGVDNRGDSHLIVWDEDNNVAYEFYRASRPSENTDGLWHADQESVWDMKTNSFRTIGDTSADAAGLSILAGLVRPDEGLPVSQGGQGAIDHAIRFTLKNNIILNQFLYPASHVANPGNTNLALQPPMGARFRLKASVDISGLNPESKIIAQAMQTYGMIVADNGSNFFFSGASDAVDASNNRTLTWNDNDIQDTLHGLKSLHFSDFEVVDLAPVVTGLSPTTGPAGSTITVTGQNFSGAAGRLEVLFGGAQATNVIVVDDSHVTATVPPGVGTVDVQVQSGISTPNDPENVEGDIFGYGISQTGAADKFTYTNNTGPPAPPSPDLEAGSDTGTSQTDNITNATVLTFDLAATILGATLELYRDGTLEGSMAADASMHATITDNGPVPPGLHSYTAKQVDSTDNRSSASTALTVQVITTPPAQPLVALDPADDSGASNTDGITNLARPRFNVTGAVVGDSYDLLDAGNQVLATLTAAATSFLIQPTASLPEGPNTLHLRARDVAGNTNSSAPVSLMVDTIAPAAPTEALLTADDSGVPGDNITSVRRPHLVGTAEAGSTVRIINQSNGQIVATALANSQGGYSAQPVNSLRPGTYMLVARATDLAGNVGPASPLFTLQIISVNGDYDGDGKADLAVFRPTTGTWYVKQSTAGGRSRQFGTTGDIPLQGDFDGDGKTDLVLFRPSTATWFVMRSTIGPMSFQFGAPRLDIPVVGDYDGDGEADFAVFRPTTDEWFVALSGGGHIHVQFGQPGVDRPEPGDYNGDGRTDLAVYRPTTGLWFIQGVGKVALGGQAGDIAAPGAYDAGGRTEPAIFRPSADQWLIAGPSGVRTVVFGQANDIAVPDDFNGDGQDELANYQPSTGTWMIQAAGPAIQFGAPNLDIPVPQARDYVSITSNFIGKAAAHRTAGNRPNTHTR